MFLNSAAPFFKIFTSVICSAGVIGLSDVSHGLQLFDKVGGKKAWFTVQGAAPPALFYLGTCQIKQSVLIV